MKKITILGGGAWGTAMANMLAINGHGVKLWCFEQEVVDSIVQDCINKKYFDGVVLDKKIAPMSSIHEAVESADIVFQAIPTPFLRKVLEQAKEYSNKNQIWISLSKGIEDKTLMFPSQIIEDVIGCKNPVVLSGPNFAIQVVEKEYSGAVVACNDKKISQEILSLCTNEFFYCENSSDVIGVQAGGALKNVLSIFLGILDSAGYKDNTIALFFSRAVEEFAKIAVHVGGDRSTVYGLSGLGDLILSIIGKKSRNYEIGMVFGKGSSLNEVAQTVPVMPEGVGTTKAVHEIIEKSNLKLSILSSTYKIVFENASIKETIDSMVHL
jgi:glycerol-3-phosphate dehydrogenase (NAD(P)+)